MTDYENGIPLAQAYLDFAPRSLVRELEEAYKFPELRNIENTPPQAAEVSWPVLLMETIVPALRAPIDIRVNMQEALLSESRKGKYILLGYLLPRNPSDPPVRIPDDLLEQRYVDWHNSAIKGAGLEFANVRSIKAPKIIPPTEDRLKPTIKSGKPVAIPESRRKPGRPSAKPLMEEAYNALDRNGELDPSATKRAIADCIQEWIEREYPGTPAPRYEAIRRYIVKRQSSKL
jgi:hypothetical protein